MSTDTKPVPVLRETILKPLYVGEEIVVSETDGSETMANASQVFTGYLDPDFKNWGTDQPYCATNAQSVTVYEMCENATFADMFGSLGADLNQLCMTQSQIIKFCVDNRNKLRTQGYATFFLFKANGEYFVAYVLVDSGWLEAYVHRFDYSRVWIADDRHRVVVPQPVRSGL